MEEVMMYSECIPNLYIIISFMPVSICSLKMTLGQYYRLILCLMGCNACGDQGYNDLLFSKQIHDTLKNGSAKRYWVDQQTKPSHNRHIVKKIHMKAIVLVHCSI